MSRTDKYWETYEEYMNRKLSESVQYKPKKEYMNRKLSESVQYKPKEEPSMAQYYDYEVEEPEEEKPKEKTDWGGVIAGVIYYGAIIGLIIFAIIKVVNGG